MKSHKINQFFGRYAAFLLRWRWAAIAIFAVILAVSFHGMSKMVQQTSFDDYFIGILTECDNHFTKESLTLMRELGEELLDSLSYGDKITSLVDHLGYHRITAVGGDLSIPFGQFVLRGELADYIDDYGNHQGCALAGLDWYPGADWTLSAQFNQTYEAGVQASLATLRISKALFNNALTLSTFAYADVKDLGLFNRLSIDWAATDQIHALVGFVILTALAEIIRKIKGYDTIKGVRASFIPFAYSFFAYTLHWWTDTEGSLAAAVEEMPAGYDELMKPVIDNVPMLIVTLLLTLPISILAMRLAEKVMKKQANKLSKY